MRGQQSEEVKGWIELWQDLVDMVVWFGDNWNWVTVLIYIGCVLLFLMFAAVIDQAGL